MYRLIEEYTGLTHPPGTMLTFTGPGRRTLPAPALVEDDDGMRLLVLRYEHAESLIWILPRVWHEAHKNGVQGIVWQSPGGYAGILAEHFIEDRIEDRNEGYGLRAFGREHAFREAPDFITLASACIHHQTPVEPESELVTVGGSGFVQLHAHSDKSELDGFSRISEMVDTAVANGDEALAITDHGVCAAHPELQALCEKAGIKPIFGEEAYFVDDRRFRPMQKPKRAKDASEESYQIEVQRWQEEQKLGRDYWHLVLWAENNEGLRNLWALTTDATLVGKYRKPRMDWESLEQHSSGLWVSTACLRGPLSAALLNEDEELAMTRLARLQGIFGDRVVLELGTTQLDEQKLLNERLVDLAKRYSVPVVAVTDSHYAVPEHKHCHQIWLAMQTNEEVQDEGIDGLFAGGHDYHLMAVDEVRDKLSYLPAGVVDEAIATTASIATACTARIEGTESKPVFSKSGKTRQENIHRDIERIVDICLANWHKVEGKPPCASTGETYEDRFEREMALLMHKSKQFCGYFLMVSDYCRWARSQGILVGPGRGSGGGCLVAYLAEITDIDPIEADLIFERFLTEGRISLPDFDVDFPQSKREVLTQRQIDFYGEEHVVRVGTQTAYKNKGIVRGLARVLTADYPDLHAHHPDINKICEAIDEAEHDSAGLGKKWDDVLVQQADVLDPFIDKYPKLFEYAAIMVGRLSSYGKHPAGIVIDPEQSLDGRLPIRWVDNDDKTSKRAIAEWDMRVLEDVLHLVKFDLLTLRNLDTLQLCMDLIAERHGEVPNPYHWTKDGEYADQNVWAELGAGRTLGCFQVETYLGTKECKVYKPTDLHGLADVITLIRPGPRKSGLTEIYHRRRSGEEAVTYPHPLLEKVLARTQGCILYQEDVMNACMLLAGYDENEADAVRKMLGKKKVEEVEEAGRKFVDACVERGIERESMQQLWDQMAEFAKYSFNRAHAYGYAMVGFWCAWFKYHYPAEFLVAVLSTVDGKRIPEFVNEARQRGFKVLPPDINESGIGFTVVDDHTIRYGLSSIKDVGDTAATPVVENRPYVSFEDFLERRTSKCNSGHIAKLVAVGAFDSLMPNRRALEQRLENDHRTSTENLCRWRVESHLGPGGLPCTFDWSTVPVELKANGEPKKNQKGPPKRCTRGCWKYDPIDLDDPAALANYTDEEIRDREKEMLGLYLSSSPFDDLKPETMEVVATFAELEDDFQREHLIACSVSSVRKKVDKNGDEYAFLSLQTHDGVDLDVVCFKKAWKRIKHDASPGRICLGVVTRNDRGFQLAGLEPIT